MHCCIERRSRRKSGKRYFRRVVTVATVSGRNQPAITPGRGNDTLCHCLFRPFESPLLTKIKRKKGARCALLLRLVEIRGFEPLTYALRTHRSTN